jgi:hypothetical protein
MFGHECMCDQIHVRLTSVYNGVDSVIDHGSIRIRPDPHTSNKQSCKIKRCQTIRNCLEWRARHYYSRNSSHIKFVFVTSVYNGVDSVIDYEPTRVLSSVLPHTITRWSGPVSRQRLCSLSITVEVWFAANSNASHQDMHLLPPSA